MESPNFNEIVGRITAYEPMAGQKPVCVRGPASYDTLNELIHENARRGCEPEKCVFYIHPGIWQELWRDLEFKHGRASTESACGRPVITNPTMPTHTVLFMAPDAVTLGGMVVNPLAIAYAELTTDE